MHVAFVLASYLCVTCTFNLDIDNAEVCHSIRPTVNDQKHSLFII